MLRSALLAVTVSALAVCAQLTDGEGLFGDFPDECAGVCNQLETSALACSAAVSDADATARRHDDRLRCGRPLSVEGVSPAISSVLADGGSEYSSERAALATATDHLLATSLTSDTSASATSRGSALTGSLSGDANATSGALAAEETGTENSAQGGLSLRRAQWTFAAAVIGAAAVAV
ncbi:hypothetical protein Rhopal_001497-T1 [Rhodotorula paludigena]|uniref:Extracellular membrane protein CFEM domain-containing protein n=1 Tax=Rhodotorula paludigena TaxID=86838 RepID=A0AAV5G7K2_9BASI|nr:hypothetical protein Rhopal_001497-T1 [Rhodotorula paludigena]